MTEDELRGLFPLLDSNASFADYPDGVTWADCAAAEALKAEQQGVDERAEELRGEGWTDVR